MFMTEVLSAIQSTFPNATMCRRNKENFLAVPGNIVDGVQTYYAVKLSALLAKDTKTNKAFDFNTAAADYETWHAEQAAKQTARKKSSSADPAKQAAKEARKTAVFEWLVANSGMHSCTDIFKALPDVYEGQTIMTVGSDCKSLSEEGKVSKTTEKNKNFYGVGE